MEETKPGGGGGSTWSQIKHSISEMQFAGRISLVIVLSGVAFQDLVYASLAPHWKAVVWVTGLTSIWSVYTYVDTVVDWYWPPPPLWGEKITEIKLE